MAQYQLHHSFTASAITVPSIGKHHAAGAVATYKSNPTTSTDARASKEETGRMT